MVLPWQRELFSKQKGIFFTWSVGICIYIDVNSPACEWEHKYICIVTKMKLPSSEDYSTH